MSVSRAYSQIPSRSKYMQTIIDTAWLYPISDVTAALATTTYPHTFDGDNIVVPNMAAFIGLYADIFAQTAISQPVPNLGYTLGVGTMLEDLGREIRFILTSGQIIMLWRNVRQLTPQLPYHIIPSPGNSPPDTIGFITTFASYGNVAPSADVDVVRVVRIG